VTGAKPPPGSVGAQDDLAEAAQLALPGEQLPAGPPAVISNTRAAVSAYAEAVADGIQARLRLRLFELIWAPPRPMTGPGNGGSSGWPCSSQYCPSRPSRP